MISVEHSEIGNEFKVTNNEGILTVMLLKNLFMIQKKR